MDRACSGSTRMRLWLMATRFSGDPKIMFFVCLARAISAMQKFHRLEIELSEFDF